MKHNIRKYKNCQFSCFAILMDNIDKQPTENHKHISPPQGQGICINMSKNQLESIQPHAQQSTITKNNIQNHKNTISYRSTAIWEWIQAPHPNHHFGYKLKWAQQNPAARTPLSLLGHHRHFPCLGELCPRARRPL